MKTGMLTGVVSSGLLMLSSDALACQTISWADILNRNPSAEYSHFMVNAQTYDGKDSINMHSVSAPTGAELGVLAGNNQAGLYRYKEEEKACLKIGSAEHVPFPLIDLLRNNFVAGKRCQQLCAYFEKCKYQYGGTDIIEETLCKGPYLDGGVGFWAKVKGNNSYSFRVKCNSGYVGIVNNAVGSPTMNMWIKISESSSPAALQATSCTFEYITGPTSADVKDSKTSTCRFADDGSTKDNPTLGGTLKTPGSVQLAAPKVRPTVAPVAPKADEWPAVAPDAGQERRGGARRR